MEHSKARPMPGRVEFTGIVAMTMATAALAIDLMLPAFAEIRAAFDLPEDSTTVAQVITFFFLGMALAQVVFGPLTDRFGRKPILYLGLGIYALGAVGTALAPSVPLLLASRAVWGVGAAATRVISQSVIRDRYSGDEMAKVLSYIMMVFILVPMVAPILGSAIVAVAPWQATVWFAILFTAVLATWSLRLPETLHPSNRRELAFGRISEAVREIMTTRLTVGTTLAMALLFGSFSSYLASSELIIGGIYDRPSLFPWTFAGTAALLGAMSFANTRLVGRFGLERVMQTSMVAFVACSAALLAIALTGDGLPPFWLFVSMLGVTLSLYSLIFPNANTLALVPMGHIAGTASAVIGTISLSGGALLGTIVDRSFASSVTPLPVAFVVYGLASLLVVTWALGGRGEKSTVPSAVPDAESAPAG